MADGSFYVVWTEDAADGTHQDILLRHFGANGLDAIGGSSSGVSFGVLFTIGSTPLDASNANEQQQHDYVLRRGPFVI